MSVTDRETGSSPPRDFDDRLSHPDLHLHVALLAPQFSDARTRLPLRELAKADGVTTSLSIGTVELAGLPVDQPKIAILQRAGRDSVAHWREVLPQFVSRGWMVVAELDDHPALIAAVHRRAVDEMDWNPIRFSHAVQTSTPLLRDVLQEFNPEVAQFDNAAFEVVSDAAAPRPDGTLRVFFGALNRGRISSKIAGHLGALSAARPNLHYDVVHDRAFFDALGDVPKSFHPELAYDAYLALMGTCDVALMPIEGAPGEAYKSDLKFVEAASRGLASIASPLVYGNTIVDEATGLIAPSIEDWAPALARLYDDPERRVRLARAARYYVETHRMFSMQVEQRIGWYRDVWRRRYELNERLFARFPPP